MSDVFYTADLHLDHANIIRHCGRPFAEVDEMNEALIERWNAVVKPGDTVYVLGDFMLTKDRDPSKRMRYFMSRLHGQKHLVLGNHDRRQIAEKAGLWCSIGDLRTVKVNKQKIVLCHYAMSRWHCGHRGAWHLYGHSHGAFVNGVYSLSFDVGVDCWGFQPVHHELVEQVMRQKELGALPVVGDKINEEDNDDEG